jgi:uncharacterized protein YciI
MAYVIHCTDKPNSLDLRNTHRSEHLAYLEANQHKLLAGGALIDDNGEGGYGGVLIVDTDDRAEAEAFAANDPFTKAGLFSGVTVTRWRKVFLNFEKLI